MALEQFKTQVLLLHSQQSTLDALGAGFNDNYTLHYATSGSEALTTLGETPIHIIVSAQDLPGMSGLEALREAKKRSPDTIGILLADDNDADVEALVGDQEVFQVVRGAVQPDALLKIVESAAKRMRMLTISKSANDNAANVDSSSLADTVSNLQFEDDDDEGEHIVMETMENGTTIISDGTGRMPVLKPEKIQVTPEAGGRHVDVLVLTKDSEFLETVRESARGLHTVHHAVTGQQAQDAVRNHKVGVLVTDAAIAGSKVELLTQNLRAHAPRLVAIVAGRRDDGDSLMELINRGQVYRFLLKPVSPGRARLAIEASVKYHLEAPETAFKGAASSQQPARAPAPKPEARPAPKPEKAAEKPVAPPEKQQAAGKSAADVVAPPAAPADESLKIPADKRRPAPARARKDEPAKSGPRGTGLPTTLIGAAAAVLVAIAGGAWYYLGGDDRALDPPTEAAAQADNETPAAADAAVDAANDTAAPATTLAPAGEAAGDDPGSGAAEPAAAVDPAYVALLDNARFARDSGRILAPAGDNAIEWYVAAREVAPGNGIVAEELAALIDQVIGMAETALLENRLGDAAEALAMIELANPANPRLAFMNAQLDQMRLRQTLDQARAAIRDARFEDAGRLLGAAGTIPGADVAAIDALVDELAQARSAQQVDDVLARANERLAAGRLTAPANDNARYFFELALTNDPDNTAARQGLLVVASRLVLQARAAVDAGNFDDAETWLADARTLDPASAELAATEDALATAVAAQAEAERQAELARIAAEEAAAAERAAEERRRAAASATLSTEPETAAPDVPAADVGGDTLALVDDAGAGSAAGAEPAAGVPDAPPAEAQAAQDSAGSAASVPDDTPITVSQLTRVNYVAPRYPRNAQRRDISGWVDIAFTVLSSGSVAAVEVMQSTPGTVFDDAAVDAVSQWRFEPVIENGRAVPKRVAVRMSFSLQ